VPHGLRNDATPPQNGVAVDAAVARWAIESHTTAMASIGHAWGDVLDSGDLTMIVVVLLLFLAPACIACADENIGRTGDAESTMTNETQVMDEQRAALVSTLRAGGIADARVLDAMGSVPRHEFLPVELRARAYENRALPIGRGQTISQPYVVAAMSEALGLTGAEKVLEIGTGSGYQAAVLSVLARSVYSVEIDPELTQAATLVLARLGYANVHTRSGDGFYGWPEEAPFDAIMVTAAAPRLPEKLIAQLVEGGRIIAPVGDADRQILVVATRRHDQLDERRLLNVVFVPMTGAVRTPQHHTGSR